MDPGGYRYNISSDRSPSEKQSVNGGARSDKDEIYRILRVVASEDWAYLEEIEGRFSRVNFNDLWELYERFGFHVKFNSIKDRASATLRLGKEEVIREQFQRPGDAHMKVEYVTRAIIVIRENYNRDLNPHG